MLFRRSLPTYRACSFSLVLSSSSACISGHPPCCALSDAHGAEGSASVVPTWSYGLWLPWGWWSPGDDGRPAAALKDTPPHFYPSQRVAWSLRSVKLFRNLCSSASLCVHVFTLFVNGSIHAGLSSLKQSVCSSTSKTIYPSNLTIYFFTR